MVTVIFSPSRTQVPEAAFSLPGMVISAVPSSDRFMTIVTPAREAYHSPAMLSSAIAGIIMHAMHTARIRENSFFISSSLLCLFFHLSHSLCEKSFLSYHMLEDIAKRSDGSIGAN